MDKTILTETLKSLFYNATMRITITFCSATLYTEIDRNTTGFNTTGLY